MNDDPALSARVVSAWWNTFRSQPVTVRSILTAANSDAPYAVGLAPLLAEVAPSAYGVGVSPHKLGRWLVRASRTPIAISSDDGTTTAYSFHDCGQIDGRQVWSLTPIPQDVHAAELSDIFDDAAA